jgi:hypothetical protein
LSLLIIGQDRIRRGPCEQIVRLGEDEMVGGLSRFIKRAWPYAIFGVPVDRVPLAGGMGEAK